MPDTPRNLPTNIYDPDTHHRIQDTDIVSALITFVSYWRETDQNKPHTHSKITILCYGIPLDWRFKEGLFKEITFQQRSYER